MDARTSDIISRLERDILSLQGLKPASIENSISLGIRSIDQSFPGKFFPTGCIHEFIVPSEKDIGATNAFIAGVVQNLVRQKGIIIWISTKRTLFPPALSQFGIEPHHIIFIDLTNERDILYVFEEALKCSSVATVIGEIQYISFKESRRFQLAAEQSRVTGFIIRHQTKMVSTIASVSRWQITSIKSGGVGDMPGVGFPRWKVELLKIRNGKPGQWNIEYASGHFREIKESKILATPFEQLKTG